MFLKKGLLKSSLKLVEVMEVSAARALVKKRLSAIKKARIVVVKQIGQGGEKYQQSKESRRRDHLKRRLKRSSGNCKIYFHNVSLFFRRRLSL